MCTFSLNSTPSSVFTDLLLTAHLQYILPLADSYLRIRAGAPLAVVVNSILAGFKLLQEYKVLIYTTASKLSVLWQTLMIQLLAYGHPVLSIKVSLVLLTPLQFL